MKARAARIISLYFIFSGIIFTCFFFVFFRVNFTIYLVLNYLLITVSTVLMTIKDARTNYESYQKQFDVGTFTFMLMYIRIGTLFLAQPGIFYLSQKLLVISHFPGEPILAVIPFAILVFLKFISHKILVTLVSVQSNGKDVDSNSKLSFLAYEFLDTLFINSFTLHAFLFTKILGLT